MELWRYLEPRGGSTPCDAASDAHAVLLADDGPRALMLDGNPLAGSGFGLPTGVDPPAIAVRSGALEPDSDDAFDHLDAARRTWSGEGRAQFDRAWADLRTQAEGLRLAVWLRPVAGDVVGDVPGIRRLASGEIKAAGVVLEPAALLTPGMVDDAEDHFVRMLEPLEGGGVLAATVVTNIRSAVDGGGRVPINAGVIDPAALVGLARRASETGPVAVFAEDAGLVCGGCCGTDRS